MLKWRYIILITIISVLFTLLVFSETRIVNVPYGIAKAWFFMNVLPFGVSIMLNNRNDPDMVTACIGVALQWFVFAIVGPIFIKNIFRLFFPSSLAGSSTKKINEKNQMCPFKPGDSVRYKPRLHGMGLRTPVAFEILKYGQTYRVADVRNELYVVVEGLENHPGGGLYWTEFEASTPNNMGAEQSPAR